MAVSFEWDPAKARTNLRKHRVNFDEASTVFADPLAKIFLDEQHAEEEARELIVGHSLLGRLLIVSFTERRRDHVRIISAQRGKNAGTMKRTKARNSGSGPVGDLLPEYEFDYNKARSNRFAERLDERRQVVALEPDVAEVFTAAESVNSVLRALIGTMPPTRGKARKTPRK